MKTLTYSRTAQGMALCRAVEYTTRRPDRRLLSDPWAARLIPNPVWRALASLPLPGRVLSTLYRWWLPGAEEYILVRARLVDDLTRAAAQSGMEQLVILGAGFDTTPFRLQDCLRDVRVFEVDHPGTQTAKVARLRRMPFPGKVIFVPIDFEREDFVERLLAAGFQRGPRSLITWLGVSYYLTPAAVARALRQVAELTGRGTGFIFDYATEAVVAGQAENPVARTSFRYAARMGEPFLSGLNPEGADTYLNRLGFKLRRHWDRHDLRQLCCNAGRRAPFDFLNIAFCERVGPGNS